MPGSALVVPEVLLAQKRVMVMECEQTKITHRSTASVMLTSSLAVWAVIEGARVDNFAYLQKHEIDRTQLAKQIGHIFARQMYEKGFFHGGKLKPSSFASGSTRS